MKFSKLYLRLLANSFRRTFFFIIIFIGFMYFSDTFFENYNSGNSKILKVSVLFINNDEKNPLTQGLKIYLKQYCDFVEMGEEQDEISKALFYGKIDCVLTVPKDFSADFIKGEEVQLEKECPFSVEKTASLDLAVQQFMNVAQMNQKQYNMGLADTVQRTLNTFQSKSSLIVYADNVSNKAFFRQYLNMLSFLLICTILSIIGKVVITLRSPNIVNRNKIAPVSNLHFKVKTVFAGFLFSILFTTVFLMIGIVLSGKNILDEACLLMIVNTYMFAVCMSAFAFLLGWIIPSLLPVDSAVNTIGVVSSFISGAFVSQDTLKPVLLKLGSMTPAFWFVKNNNELSKLSSIHQDDWVRFLIRAGISVGFTAVFLVITLIISEKKIRQES